MTTVTNVTTVRIAVEIVVVASDDMIAAIVTVAVLVRSVTVAVVTRYCDRCWCRTAIARTVLTVTVGNAGRAAVRSGFHLIFTVSLSLFLNS